MLDRSTRHDASDGLPGLTSGVYPEVDAHHYRPDIDGLRAVAVGSVVLFHAFPSIVRGGFIGVDIFFVISGFLITSLIVKGLTNDAFSFVDFYSRRIRRIFPGLILVLVACLLIGRAILFPGEDQQLGKHVLGGTGFVSNLLLWRENGYFDNSSDTKPLLHLWSLGIEEQFYIIWPMMLWIAFRLRINASVLIVVAGGVSFWLNVTEVVPNSVAAFYSPQTRFWELLVGAALAAAPLPSIGRSQREALSIGGGTLIAAGLFTVTSATAFPGWWALLPTFGAVMLIAAGPLASLNRILSNRVSVWFGLISYPLYLWHWPLLSFARILRGREPTALMAAGLVLASIALAWMTFRWLELPIRKGGHSRLKTLALVGAAIAVGLVGFLQYNPFSYNMVDDASAIESQFVGPSTPWKYDVNDTCLKHFPMPGADQYAWWFCMLQHDAPPTVILLGDSRTNDLFPGFAKNASLAGENVLSIGACGPRWIDKPQTVPEATTSPCSADRPYHQMIFINSLIEANKSLRLAVLSSLPATFDSDYIAAIRKRISFLESHGIMVVMFASSVPLGYDIRACYSRAAQSVASTCEVDAGPRETILENFSALKQEILRTNPKTAFYDPNDLNCGRRHCNFKLDGMPMLRDQYGHLSEYASVQLIKNFSAWASVNAPNLIKTGVSTASPNK